MLVLYDSYLLYACHTCFMLVLHDSYILCICLYVSWLIYTLYVFRFHDSHFFVSWCCMLVLYDSYILYMRHKRFMTRVYFIYVGFWWLIYALHWILMTHIYFVVGVACWCCTTHIYFICVINVSWLVHTLYMFDFDDSHMLYIRFWWLIFTL